MIRINLIPKEERKKVRKKRRMGVPKIGIPGIDLIGSFVLLLIAVGVLFFMHRGYTARIKKVKENIAVAKEELKKLESEVKVVKSFEKKQKELNVLIDLVKELNKNRSLMIHLLDELNYRKPDYIWYTSLNLTTTSMNLEGITFSNQLVPQLMDNLEKSAYISNVQLVEVQDGDFEGHTVKTFSITANVHPPSGGK